MGMIAQGVRIRTATTGVVNSSLSSLQLDVRSTSILSTNATTLIDFVSLGFTTFMVLSFPGSTKSTGYYPIKSVVATAIGLYANLSSLATGLATNVLLAGTSMISVGEVTDFDGPGGQAAEIDFTHLQSVAKEKKVGLADEGQLSLTLNYNATDDGQNQLRADRANRLERLYDISYTDTSLGSSHFPSRDWFMGNCMGFSKSGAVDNKISAKVVISINGPVISSTKISS